MKEINVYVWWSFGRDDGGGYDDTVEIEDEDYLKLARYYVENEEIPHSYDLEDDEEVKRIVEKIEEEALDGLEDNSKDGYRGCEEEDEDGNKIDFDDWYENIEKNVDISMDDYDHDGGEYRFCINISNGGESFVDYEISGLEHYLICKADEEGEEYGEVKGLEEFHKGIMEAAREKLEEDLELTGDDPSILDDMTFTVSLDN